MTLRQSGAKATGHVALTGWDARRLRGPVEGTINGDVPTFSRLDGLLRGEATVAADEMAGTVTFVTGARTLSLNSKAAAMRPMALGMRRAFFVLAVAWLGLAGSVPRVPRTGCAPWPPAGHHGGRSTPPRRGPRTSRTCTTARVTPTPRSAVC
jgi:hypothetical protein